MQELNMFQMGNLPADYRPPAQGQWDDAIERWAYAWQFPATEDSRLPEERIVKSKDFPLLLEFTRLLVDRPPSSAPGSAQGSPYQLPPPNEAEGSPALPLAEQKDEIFAELEQQLADLCPVAIDETPRDYSKVTPAAKFSSETNIPVAYLDDGSELTAASRRLGSMMEKSFGLTYEEHGLTHLLFALACEKFNAEAKALFLFIKDVGLGPTPDMYRALMRIHTQTGEVNGSMAIIEEMKTIGMTPRIGNWHELMMCFHHARDYGAVQQIVDNMKMYANIEPTEVTFAIQLRALARDKTRLSAKQEAIQLFDQMENVYGYIASRPHYHALMHVLCQSPQPEMRLRVEELGKKMEMLGMLWDGRTFLFQIMAAQVAGDVKGVEKLLAKMRNEQVPMEVPHAVWSVHAHTQAMLRADYALMKEKGEDPLPLWLDHIKIAHSIFDLVQQRGWKVNTQLLNAVLRMSCQVTILSMEHKPDDVETTGKFESQATAVWENSFTELSVPKDAYSFECYIALLAHQQRIDEAEKLFQALVLTKDATPTRRTYEALVFMHICSGEEGGAARGLHYLEAMERTGLLIRPSLIRKIVNAHNAAGYRRDMKRRARRIIQAREEYMARKQEGVDMSPKPYTPPERDADGNLVAVPLPLRENTTLAWWDRWKRESRSKHELFDSERADGMPRGESFEEKNKALQDMGIESNFLKKEQVPDPSKSHLLAKLRTEGEVTGSLWSLDGGELSYPKDGGGPEGWGVRLWRDRRLMLKEHQKVLDGKAEPPEFSEIGVGTRPVADQLLIEESKAKNALELHDAQKYPDHRYDDGSMKPASEMAHPVPHSAELVWHQEAHDKLAPYKTDDEIAMQNDNAFFDRLEKEGLAKTEAVVQALKHKAENTTSITGRGVTRRSKHDYLEKWREMYRQGTLEVPDEPLERFGRTPEDHAETLARTVRQWYQQNRMKPASDDQLKRWSDEEQRAKEAALTKQELRRKKSRRIGKRKTG
jgi:hypothetical protein